MFSTQCSFRSRTTVSSLETARSTFGGRSISLMALSKFVGCNQELVTLRYIFQRRNPPSELMTWPVIQALSSETSQDTKRETS
jgi:hypothetical protein